MNEVEKKRVIESAKRGSLHFPMIFVDEKNRDSELWEITAISGMNTNGGLPSEIELKRHDLKTGESFIRRYKIV